MHNLNPKDLVCQKKQFTDELVKIYNQINYWDYTHFPLGGATQLSLVPFPCNEIR